MTEQTNAELIAEAQEASASEHEELGDDAYVGGLLDRLAVALKAADQRAENAERQHRLSQQAWAETLSDRNQYAAVVEKVRGFCDKALAVRIVESSTSQAQDAGLAAVILREALATAPADALRERDAEKWDEGAEMGHRLYAEPMHVIEARNPHRNAQ